MKHAHDRRAPTIQQLAKSYNDLCATLQDLVKKKKARKGVVGLEPIPDSSLWKLDIDDNIWHNLGLEDDSSDHTPPPWLKAEKTRLGIRHMLDHNQAFGLSAHTSK